MPRWNLHEQLLRYYSINSNGPLILSAYLTPDEVREYAINGTPFVNRGIQVEPNHPIYTVSKIDKLIPYGFGFDRQRTLAETNFLLYKISYYP